MQQWTSAKSGAKIKIYTGIMQYSIYTYHSLWRSFPPPVDTVVETPAFFDLTPPFRSAAQTMTTKLENRVSPG